MILFRQGKRPKFARTAGVLAFNRHRGRWILHVGVPCPVWWVWGRAEGFFSTSIGFGPLFLLVLEKPSRVRVDAC